MSNEELYKKCYAKACDFLAQREHSTLELYNKLNRQFLNKVKPAYEIEDIDSSLGPDTPEQEDALLIHNVINELQERGYLSNTRFTEKFVESKLRRNIGPLMLQKQLKLKGITNELWLEVWSNFANDEAKYCQAALEKWLGSTEPSSLTNKQNWAKAARFLANRGFYQHTIYETLATISQ